MNIVAIGGGGVGAGETLRLDQELVRLSGVNHPQVLFIPTASDDSSDYVREVEAAYGRLGCSVDTLLLCSPDADPKGAETKIKQADLVYVGGGNTKAMIARWRELGVDEMLRAHLLKGKPAGGVSAGAICWARIANSDWPQYEGISEVNTARLDCLGFADVVLCPHTLGEEFRLAEFRAMMKEIPGPGIGIDDCCAVQIAGNKYRILAAHPGVVAHRIEWIAEQLHERVLEPHDDFRPLSEIS